MKNIYIVLIILMICVPVGGLKVEAATQMDISWTKASNDNNNNNDGVDNPTRLFTRAFQGDIATVVIKTLDFILPDGRTAPNASTLDIGQEIRLNRNDTSAHWYVYGGFNDSPPSNGIYYNLDKNNDDFTIDRKTTSGEFSVHIAEAQPRDASQPFIESRNPSVLSCDGYTKCTAENPGTALIKVTFPPSYYSWLGTLLGRPRVLNSENIGFGSINILTKTYKNRTVVSTDRVVRPYSFEPMYFQVTVNPRPSIPPGVSCLPSTNMSTTGGTFNWSYNDSDGDAQTAYSFKLSSRNSNFGRDYTIFEQSYNSNNITPNGGSVIVPKNLLLPNTTYYALISSYNNKDGWVKEDCEGSFQTLPIPVPIAASASCTNGGETGNITWTNAAGYNTAYMRVLDKTLYPDNSYENLPNNSVYRNLWNENFVGNSYNFTTIPGHKYDWWMHTKDTSIADTTYKNYSEPVGGSLSCSATAGVCAVDQDGTKIKDTCASSIPAINKLTTTTDYTWLCPSSNPSDSATICTLPRTIINPECTTEPCPPIQPPVCTGPSCPPGGGEDNATKPTISITKTPSVTLNKNGSCKLSWDVTNIPLLATCSIKGWGIGGNVSSVGNKILDISEDEGSETIANLQSNQRYTITCSGGTLTPAISESVICRVNPDIKEN